MPVIVVVIAAAAAHAVGGGGGGGGGGAGVCWWQVVQREGFVLDLVQDIRNINMKAMKARHTGNVLGQCSDVHARLQQAGACRLVLQSF